MAKSNGIEIPTWLTPGIFIESLKDKIKGFEQIVKFEVEPAVATGENFMTTLLRAKLEMKLKDGTTKELSYIIKVLPNTEQMQAMVKSWQVFEKEEKIYKEYIPEFAKMYAKAGKTIDFGPKIINIKKANIQEYTIILEDLRLKGYINAPRQNGLDMAHSKHVLEKLAQFHAASACLFEVKGSYPEIFKKCLCSAEDVFVGYRERQLKLLLECLPSYNATHLEEKMKLYQSKTSDQFQIAVNPNPNEFNVLNHGDAWANNIMFQYDATGNITETIFIDFQMSRYGPPAQDLLYFILSSTCLEDKFKNFDCFIQFYYDKLIENLILLKYSKRLLKLKELHVSLYHYGDWAYTIAINVLPVVLFKKSGQASADNLYNDDDLKRAMFSNESYVQHMRKLLPWMEKRGLLDFVEN